VTAAVSLLRRGISSSSASARTTQSPSILSSHASNRGCGLEPAATARDYPARRRSRRPSSRAGRDVEPAARRRKAPIEPDCDGGMAPELPVEIAQEVEELKAEIAFKERRGFRSARRSRSPGPLRGPIRAAD